MKTVISISLESSDHDYEFETEFLGQTFRIQRIGVDKDTKQAELLIRQWQYKADA
ncbi:MAG: quinate 5-dehydrogenase, partial [Pseudomonadales bacterium]|nr:quinate 5-dehydrogenase [Pseudomonadales bacterium]